MCLISKFIASNLDLRNLKGNSYYKKVTDKPMRKHSIYFLLPILIFISACDLITEEKKDDSSVLIGLLALARGTSSSSSTSNGQKYPTPTCEVSAPAFSTLKDAGFESTCGQSGCHVTGGAGAVRFRANTYSEILSYTNAGVPSTSTLYKEQSTGTMAIYTTQSIDKAIYCWILGGSKP
jgi:hypothetical protein